MRDRLDQNCQDHTALGGNSSHKMVPPCVQVQCITDDVYSSFATRHVDLSIGRCSSPSPLHPIYRSLSCPASSMATWSITSQLCRQDRTMTAITNLFSNPLLTMNLIISCLLPALLGPFHVASAQSTQVFPTDYIGAEVNVTSDRCT